MKKLILYCDFMGFHPELQISGNPVYKSIITGIISILICIVSILCIGYFGSELFVHSSPIVVSSKEIYDDFGPFQVSNKEFLVMIGLEYKNYSLYVDPSIYEVTAEAIIVINEKSNATGEYIQKVENVKVDIDICSKYYKEIDIYEKNLKIDLTKNFCPNPNSAIISGFWGSLKSPFRNLKVHFRKCRNSTEKLIKCKSPEEIDSIIQDGYVSINYSRYYLNQKNFSSPFKKIIFNDYNMLNANSSLEYAIDLLPISFKSDNGIIFEDIINYEGFEDITKIFYKMSRSDDIVTFNFQGNSTGNNYKRYYTKLQSIITEIGGFIKGIMLLGTLLSSLLSKNYFFAQYLTKYVINEDEKSRELRLPSKFYSSNQAPSTINQIKKENIFNRNGQENNKIINISKNAQDQLQNNYNNKSGIIPNSYISSNIILNKIMIPNEKTKKSTKQSLMTLLVKYLVNLLCCFSKNKYKNFEYLLMNGMDLLYRNTLSFEVILKQQFEHEKIKKLLESKYKGENFFKIDTEQIIQLNYQNN